MGRKSSSRFRATVTFLFSSKEAALEGEKRRKKKEKRRGKGEEKRRLRRLLVFR